MPIGWRIQESGWWTHDDFGGICREADGKWYGYPKLEALPERFGPFVTAYEAAMAIQRCGVVVVEA